MLNELCFYENLEFFFKTTIKHCNLWNDENKGFKDQCKGRKLTIRNAYNGSYGRTLHQSQRDILFPWKLKTKYYIIYIINW